MINGSKHIKDLSLPPSNRLHRLKGNMKDYWPVSINMVPIQVCEMLPQRSEDSLRHQPGRTGRIIRDDYLEPLGFTVVKMSQSLRISRQTLTAILNERAGVTPEMALKLSEAFDTTPELWLNLQKAYDLFVARKNTP